MKKLVIVFVILSLLSVNAASAAETPIKVFMNGEQVWFDVDPVQEKGTTLVQFKPIFEQLGLGVSLDKSTKTITGSKKGLTVKFTVNNKAVYINGTKQMLTIPVKEVKGATFVPVQLIGTITGSAITWDPKQKTMYIGKVAQNNASNNASLTFRNTKWGMSKAQVKKSESAELGLEQEDLVVFRNVNMAVFQTTRS